MSEKTNLVKLWGNDKQRQAFLKDYTVWGEWLTTPELGLVYYRYLMPDGTAIIAMEHNHYTYAGYNQGYKWDRSVCYYTQKPNVPFSPGSKSSISVVAEILKNAKVSLQKEAR